MKTYINRYPEKSETSALGEGTPFRCYFNNQTLIIAAIKPPVGNIELVILGADGECAKSFIGPDATWNGIFEVNPIEPGLYEWKGSIAEEFTVENGIDWLHMDLHLEGIAKPMHVAVISPYMNAS